MYGCLKVKIYSDGSIDKLRLIILVRGDLKNTELIGDTWSPTSSTSYLKYFLENAVNYKARMHYLYFIGAFLQAKFKNRVFVKLNSRTEDYLPEYSSHFGKYLILLKYMYGMTNSGKLLYDELIDWLIDEAGSKQFQCQMSIYYQYAPYGTEIIF